MIQPFVDVQLLLPELFLSLAAMAILIIGVFLKNDHTRMLSYAGALSLLVACFLVPSTEGPASAFNDAFRADAFSRFGRIAVFIAAALALLISHAFFKLEKLLRPEYVVLVLLSAIGMGLMVSATDLISVYLGVELQSLCVYIMATLNRDSKRSTEAGLKYFVLGALSSGFLLYGASLIYGFTGSTQFADIAAASVSTDSPVGLSFGLVFFVSALAFKVSAAPFHMWTPDVYEGSPTPVTAFLAAAPKLAGMFLFGRVLVQAFPGLTDQWQPVLWLIAAASMVVGSLSAIVQTNIKRLMAYSSIGHMGYALIGVTAGTATGISGMVSYMLIYLIMTLGVFACILMMRRPEGMAENISDLSGLSQSRPGLAIAFTVLFLSLAGIPPFIGFFAKFFVFTAAVEEGLFILAIVGVVTSVIATFYYLSVIRTIWFAEPAPDFVREHDTIVRVTAIGSAVVVTIGLVFLIGPLASSAGTAAEALFPVSSAG
ncbi:NADH-quinone oxidoreductase subunit NuoN [Parvularcula sp. ZS-1/3]|uniref:NADH-quinone oxidoreductase subunit N n=1 Tax=Parvularcula mediterranea TaxID=2732508 RepID=A0A7Y3RJI6_9PROT|nr:NADH-quinone oxidoreductase subunit NuoN [Parvularcula mediterranea]NNU15254.1 NADH-quinone oxidoreductase subunit NuoN [Parvularcula mediterranea]